VPVPVPVPVPVVVVSTNGEVAVVSTVEFVTVVVSTVEGVVKLEESALPEPSPPLLQAANVPAIATIAKNFFIFTEFKLTIKWLNI
jgi:hypothetical protein